MDLAYSNRSFIKLIIKAIPGNQPQIVRITFNQKVEVHHPLSRPTATGGRNTQKTILTTSMQLTVIFQEITILVPFPIYTAQVILLFSRQTIPKMEKYRNLKSNPKTIIDLGINDFRADC
jgi:hypothetical protein